MKFKEKDHSKHIWGIVKTIPSFCARLACAL